MLKLGVLALAFVCVATTANAEIATMSPIQAANDRAWRAWDAATLRRCPSHHVEWLYGATYPYLYRGFNRKLHHAERRRVEASASVRPNCAEEEAGHSCELGNYLRAYVRFGLLNTFVNYSCRVTRCDNPALCSRAPGQ